MDKFYNIHKLSLQEKKNLINDCKSICYDYWIDKLDCNVSWARQRTDLSFEDIMKKCNEGTHFVVIDRDYYPIDEKKHFEVGFRVMSNIDYFLFMWIEDDKMPSIIQKYNLEFL